MTGAQYIVESLIRHGVNDAFGVPGGVILGLLYEMENHKPEFIPHLSYHEQCAGFAACGYAQASGKIGVAYATRGPGFTNLITAIAEAYYDSLSTLFITAHSDSIPIGQMRVMSDQEMDTCSMVRNITKMAVRIDDKNVFCETIDKAIAVALDGRKGPVLLDISSQLFSNDVPIKVKRNVYLKKEDYSKYINEIESAIRNAKRPIILAGDGINQVNTKDAFRKLIKRIKIPVISSRFSHDVMAGQDNYYGYIGSHGMRCANFILSKTDLILSLGNRLHFPPKSKSYNSVMNHAKLLRVEIDENEFNRTIQNSINYRCELKELINQSVALMGDCGNHDEWIKICDTLKNELKTEDIVPVIDSIMSILHKIDKKMIVVSDVGNNEFWLSRAAVESNCRNRVMYSKSFGAMGCGLGKAIGAYYGSHKPVVCVVGDQGLQLNIQELQYISQYRLPISIVLLNNKTSGMIKDRELSCYHIPLHTTKESGYETPDFKAIAQAYGIKVAGQVSCYEPIFMEIDVNPDLSLSPVLPRGEKCQDMLPKLPIEKYRYLNSL